MIRLPTALERAGLKATMLLQVHDELIFEVPDHEVADTKALVEQVMENAAQLDVPLVVEAGSGANWAEAHPSEGKSAKFWAVASGDQEAMNVLLMVAE